MNFDCPYCGQNLDADADLGGTMLNCPTCKNEIIVPNQHPNRAGGGMKMCPFCSEPIKAAAVKCKHCGSMLDRPFNAPYAPSNIITNQFSDYNAKAERFPRYEELPWQQKEGVLNFIGGIGVFCFFMGITFFKTFWMFGIAFLFLLFPSIILISSVVYKKKQDSKGKLVECKRMDGMVLMACCLIPFIAFIYLLMGGGSPTKTAANPIPYVEVNNGRLYYIAPATEAEATALGEHLTPNVFNGDEKLIELSYTNGEYHILAPVRPGYENDMELRQELAVMALTASAEIFNNKTVKMDLCDQQYTVFASVSCLDGASLVVDATAPTKASFQQNSSAYDKGYAYGQRMAKQDQSFGTYKQASADTSLNDQFFWGAKTAGYSMGTPDYGEFVSGYEKGYAMTR